ncbi:DUF397 domain-containing protein [Streptomyces yangpuensis]|uniref:DUF397 domain-containing protein n=1 Tax=Streptomyces yangpuensis TaxID=1648182 RepID=A0ABY5PU47_9ACTN|nr:MULTISPECIES: DUF397 domain-containing protein [Streptomyces]UUY47624.1 DUF397 domain-containing protein [Streptomyces yangpuensis]
MDTSQHLTGAKWRKSSYSGDTGGNCVECAPLGSLAWRKSSYSGDTGGDCIECAPLGSLAWRKASYSSDTGGECVEVAEQPCLVAVRDSKNPGGPVLTVGPAAFAAFVRAASV